MLDAIVAYFSVTGITAMVARSLAEAIAAPVFEIHPDLAGQEAEYELCDFRTIYLGLPVWWYAAPSIVNRFLETCNFAGKTIIPFATSLGNGMDQIRGQLEKCCRGAVIKDATLLSGEMTREELLTWAEENRQ